MAIPDSFIQDLVQRTDIEQLVSGYVTLRRRGRNLLGLCPFHGEKTPSFTLYPESNSFYCFGCGAGGDVISFVRRIENLDYIDALKFLADRAGLRMPEQSADDALSRQRVRILELNRTAARQFHEWLWQPPGAAALQYYRGRGISDAMIRRFGLGAAPDSFHMLRDTMRSKGFHDEELIAAFLCKRSRRNNSLYDIFKNRVICPIIDVRGQVVGFGGRVLDDSKPKYINTSDTPVYSKTEQLFALNLSKSALGEKRQLILCEGYMDVIALHQFGFTNAVATLGTAFTAGHARLLARYADEVLLLFDADAPGQKGAGRAIDILRNAGLRVRVVRMPDGIKDPDQFLHTYSADQFKPLLQGSVGDIDFRLDQIASKYELSSSEQRVRYLQEAVDLVAGLSSAIEQDVYAGRLAEECSVSKSAILQQLRTIGRKKDRTRQQRQLGDTLRSRDAAGRTVNPEAAGARKGARAEEGLLGLLLYNPDYIPGVRRILSPDHMVTDFNRRLYALILSRFDENAPLELPFLSACYESDEMAYIAAMLQKAREYANTPEEALALAGAVAEAHRERTRKVPGDMTDDELREHFAALRKKKQPTL